MGKLKTYRKFVAKLKDAFARDREYDKMDKVAEREYKKTEKWARDNKHLDPFKDIEP